MQGDLVAVMDVHDVLGKMDDYFPKAKLFTDEETFFSFIDQKNLSIPTLDYLVVCTPNHLHARHIVGGLSAGLHVITEKPLCLTHDELEEIRLQSTYHQRSVYTIMQLRFHEEVQRLRSYVLAQQPRHRFDVKVSYFTPRGQWYDASWKSDPDKSGGILMNIGIHLFDLMAWIFGERFETVLVQTDPRYAEGYSRNPKADVHWKLGIDCIGSENKLAVSQPIRLLEVDGTSFDLSVYDSTLHTISYESIISGKGFDIDEASLGLDVLFNLKQNLVRH